MIKKLICTGLMLTVGVTGLVACGMQSTDKNRENTFSATVLDTSSASAHSAPDGIEGVYLSEAGDGELLELDSDGGFVARTVTDLCSETGAVAMTETVTGTYTETETGVCTLKIETITYAVEGLDGSSDEINAYVDLLAGADEELRTVYTRLFGGEVLTGSELFGAETFEQLRTTDVIALFDFENGTFCYQNESEDTSGE